MTIFQLIADINHENIGADYKSKKYVHNGDQRIEMALPVFTLIRNYHEKTKKIVKIVDQILHFPQFFQLFLIKMRFLMKF